MLTVGVDSLAPGMYFDSPVYLEKGFILLSPDTPISEELIERLKRWQYGVVYTDGKLVNGPSQISEPGGEGESQNDGVPMASGISESLAKLYLEQLDFTRALFIQYAGNNELDLNRVTEQMKAVIAAIKREKEFVVHFSEIEYPTENYLVTHSMHTMLLGLGIGTVLRLPHHRLIELGTASLLHDIGLTRIPDQVYLGTKPLTAESRKTLMGHTVLGYRILKGFAVPEDVALTALEHHERADGKGYPRGLSGKEVCAYAKIVAVACIYDILTTSTPFLESFDDLKTVTDLFKAQRVSFDGTVMRALSQCLGIHTPGTAVLLSDKTMGVVTQTNPKDPRYPKVKLLFDADGKRYAEDQIIATSRESRVRIVRNLSREEIPQQDT